VRIFKSEFSKRITNLSGSCIMIEMKIIFVLLLEILLSKQNGFSFCSKIKFINDYILHLIVVRRYFLCFKIADLLCFI